MVASKQALPGKAAAKAKKDLSHAIVETLIEFSPSKRASFFFTRTFVALAYRNSGA
jgi:hypothetical protein